jgi:hypothetical protein
VEQQPRLTPNQLERAHPGAFSTSGERMKKLAIAMIVAATALTGCAVYEVPARDYGARDRDRDGIPNRYDRDRDGDGVRNRNDARPNNPNRY